jgi:hypothetical protein
MELIAYLINRYRTVIVKTLDPVMVTLWKLGLGRLFNLWPAVFGNHLIVKHSDHKNGTPNYSPIHYLESDSMIYFAINQGVNSEWVQNIVANPQVEVWLPDGWYAGQADVVELPSDRLSLLRRSFKSNPISARIAGIEPELEDKDFDLAVEDYVLIRVVRQSPRTGVNGPGGLAWLWPFILIFLLGLRPRKRR